MNKFICPYCQKQLDNQALWYMEENQNANEFWCDDCGKIYILGENGSCIVEESI
jgi:uncharacterized protein YbaR (Trm112 family)